MGERKNEVLSAATKYQLMTGVVRGVFTEKKTDPDGIRLDSPRSRRIFAGLADALGWRAGARIIIGKHPSD